MPKFTYTGLPEKQKRKLLRAFEKDFRSSVIINSWDGPPIVARKKEQAKAEKPIRLKELEKKIAANDARLLIGIPGATKEDKEDKENKEAQPIVFPKGKAVSVAKNHPIYAKCMSKCGFFPDGTEISPHKLPCGPCMKVEAEKK